MNAKDWTPEALAERVEGEGLRFIVDVCQHEDGTWWATAEDIGRIYKGDGIHAAVGGSEHLTPQSAAADAIVRAVEFKREEAGVVEA